MAIKRTPSDANTPSLEVCCLPIVHVIVPNFGRNTSINVVDTSETMPANGLINYGTGKDDLVNQAFAWFNNLGVSIESSGEYKVVVEFEANGNLVSSEWEFDVSQISEPIWWWDIDMV